MIRMLLPVAFLWPQLVREHAACEAYVVQTNYDQVILSQQLSSVWVLRSGCMCWLVKVERQYNLNARSRTCTFIWERTGQFWAGLRCQNYSKRQDHHCQASGASADKINARNLCDWHLLRKRPPTVTHCSYKRFGGEIDAMLSLSFQRYMMHLYLSTLGENYVKEQRNKCEAWKQSHCIGCDAGQQSSGLEAALSKPTSHPWRFPSAALPSCQWTFTSSVQIYCML